MTVLNILLFVIGAILFLCILFLSFWLADEDKIPHAPQKAFFPKHINSAIGTFSIFILGEIIVTVILALVLKYYGFNHLFASSWLLKSGFIALGGYIMFYIDKRIRNKAISLSQLIVLTLIVVAIVSMFLSLCSKLFFYMLLVPISFISLMYMITIKELLEDDKNSSAFDYSPMALSMGGSFILFAILAYLKSLIDGEPYSKEIVWSGIFAIIIGVWWLWVTMSFMANMQKKADRYFEMSEYTCFLYATELVLAYIILIVKNFIPSIKDVYENIEDIDIDV